MAKLKSFQDQVYGNWFGYGWGVMTFHNEDEESTKIDFDPEIESWIDVKYFWRNRRKIIALENIGLTNYLSVLTKILWSRLRLKLRSYRMSSDKKIKLPKIEKNTNSTVDDRKHRFNLNCSFCRPNKGENKKNYKKHGTKKPKKKDHRR
jgi:hypothetical protein